MFLSENNSLLLFYVQTPMHAGAGSATGAVDLPIQRERHTGRPIVQSSGVKGALRDTAEQVVAREKQISQKKAQEDELIRAIFGSEGEKDAQAGAMSVTDAKLLLFPVRSSHAPFVFVTCPSVLRQLNRDLESMNQTKRIEIPEAKNNEAFGFGGDLLASALQGLILEDLRVSIKASTSEPLRNFIAGLCKPFGNEIIEKTVILSDQDFTFLVKTACPVQTRIQLGPNGTTSDGGNLWYQELLPNDSILYSQMFMSDERKEDSPLQEKGKMAALSSWLKDNLPRHIQMGGDASLGRGICEIQWWTINKDSLSSGGQ